MEFLVYASGPIRDTSYDECTQWREELATQLRPHGIRVLSPMRAKKFLKSQGTMRFPYENHPLTCQKGITARDRNDVMRSDLILVNFIGAEKVSIGTVMEIAWADAFRKPIVLAMEQSNIHEHAILNEVAGFIVPTLEEAIAITKAILLPQ